MAAPQTPSPASVGSSPATTVPKRLLTKTKRALSEADLSQATSDKPVSPSKTQGGGGQPTESSDQNTQSPPPKSSIGMFHHLPHYMKLYEIIKGAYANNQVISHLFDTAHKLMLLKKQRIPIWLLNMIRACRAYAFIHLQAHTYPYMFVDSCFCVWIHAHTDCHQKEEEEEKRG